jgi:hypothetical protein
MKKCSNDIMRRTGYLHILSLIITAIGSFLQIKSLINNEPTSIYLSLSLVLFLLLRIPNQICVAINVGRHGWYTVIGSLFGVISFSVITYLEHKKNIEYNREKIK